MANDVELNDRRAPYTATSGQTVFDIDFSMENLSDDDVAVYQNGVLLTKTTHYTVDLDVLTITLVTGATTGDSIVVEGDAQIVRETAFPRAGDLRTAILNGDFRRVFFILQEQARDIGRVLLLNSAESGGFNARLPLLQGGKLLGVNAGKTGFDLYSLSDFPDDFDVVTAGLVAGDILEYDGAQFVNITRDALKASLGLKQNNFSATAAPTVNDDSDDGYAVGSKWIDTTNNNVWHCVDATVGAAVWELGDLESSDLGAAVVKGVDADFSAPSDDNVPTTEAVQEQIDLLPHNNALHLQHREASGTDGGSSSATTYHTRDLNTVVKNTITGASHDTGTGVSTLPTGIYRVKAFASAFAVGAHFIRIYDIDNTSEIVRGLSSIERIPTATQGFAVINNEEFEILDETDVRLEHYTQGAQTSNGFGQASAISGQPEIFADVYIEKVG